MTRRRIIELHGRDWPLDAEAPPLLVPGPLDEMDRLVEDLSRHQVDVLEEGKRRLQHLMVVELQRLVGEFVTEVENAETLYEKIGRAIATNKKVIQSRPPDHYIARCSDPAAFARLCRAACDGMVRFMAATINEARAEKGEPPLPAAEKWVRLAAREVHEAVALADIDGVDRMAELAVRFARTFETGAHMEGARELGRADVPAPEGTR